MFRRSGSFASFLVHGVVPAPGSEEFCAALAAHRFQSIETVASEQDSIGWVTPTDPTGESFVREDMDHDAAWWLRLRMDKKKLPTTWLSIYASTAERSRGRPLNRKERRELKEELERRLLPKVLPTVKLVDALYVPARQQIHLFATGTSVRDAFTKLFAATFDAQAFAAEPRVLAQSFGLGREPMAYLDQVSPVRWPRDGKAPQLSVVEDDERKDPWQNGDVPHGDVESGDVETGDAEGGDMDAAQDEIVEEMTAEEAP